MKGGTTPRSSLRRMENFWRAASSGFRMQEASTVRLGALERQSFLSHHHQATAVFSQADACCVVSNAPFYAATTLPPTVKDYLSEVAQGLLRPESYSLLPNGWSMFRDFSARIPVEAPAGLEALEVDLNVELIVAGGLRIGRSNSWLTGAPPRILVSGMEAQDRIKVNGASVGVSASGKLLAAGVFTEPGEYIIDAGSRRRRIKIERPKVSVQSQAELRESLDAGRSKRIALPHGSWTLIGNSPDQICYSHGNFFRGTVASCPFHPSWAVQVGAGPGAVVAVAAYPSPPRMLSLRRLTRQTRTLIEQWSSVVYAAHIRRPSFVGLYGAVPDEGIVDVWRNYASIG